MTTPSDVSGSVTDHDQVPGQPAAAIKRRAPIACRRCRRMRSKCVHKGKSPCQACEEAGIGPASCIFPVRGQPDNDRDFRHPRPRPDNATKRDLSRVRREILDAPVVRQPGPAPNLQNIKGADDWDSLPPLGEIIEAANQFTQHYFQLGFIPKRMFIERLQTNHRSISVFFLLSILSVSARLTPSLIRRYGTAVKAAETFMTRASAVALGELYKGPDLERCQAFYLLSIAQQGSGMKTNSAINMAIATRMAFLMELHREETYVLVMPTKELIVRAESARRTLWMLHSQDNLHSGPKTPVSLTASDITALLPGNEADFAGAREPNSRAALEGTPPAIKNPALISDPGRSLFATLVQTHHFWGAISRRALSYNKSECPWQADSEFAKMSTRLREWESKLPHEHQWSPYLLKGYKQERQDLAYLGMANATRLCNIVIRKAYLHEIISHDKSDPDLARFWSDMSLTLFQNVRYLYEQIETQHSERTPEDGNGAQMAAFCVYTCGFLAAYLCKFPNICPDASITKDGRVMVERCLTILSESKSIWPLASRWYDHLEKWSMDQKNGIVVTGEGSMSDSREPIPHALHPHTPVTPGKPGQPRATNPVDEAQSPSAAPQTVAPQLSPDPALYLLPNLRLAVVQAQARARGQSPPIPPSSHESPPPSMAGDPASHPSTDGLGLLIQASSFSTHPQSQQHSQQLGLLTPGVAASPGFVHQAHPDYYPQMALATNDGYENELQYCVSDGVPAMQTWAGGNSLYY